eukprot:5189641-Prymnesium_polylepis.1
MVFFAAALAHLVPGLLHVGQQRHLRQKLVDGAPQTVAVAYQRLSRGKSRVEGRVSGLDHRRQGGAVGARRDRAGLVGQGVPK